MSGNGDRVSRRNFLSGTGALLIGAAAGAVGHGFVEPARAAVPDEAKWPWPYTALDVETVRKKGHQGYYVNSCSQGAFYAIISELRKEVGAPYTFIPVELMAYGKSGVAGWCTLCGALNGACATISLTCKDYGKVTGELLAWFAQTPFPSDISNRYAANHEFLVDTYKSDKVLPQTISGSPLCHVNVSKWCKEHGFASGSSERSERCARISGDVAAKTVELLNDYHAGKFTPVYDLSQTTQTCRACHKKGKDFEKGNWTRGKMDCGDCHIQGHVVMVEPTHPD